jgi:hypothetical protein
MGREEQQQQRMSRNLTQATMRQPAPLQDSPPLTAREEEMLRLIKGLQQRVALLEARDTFDSGEMKPAQGDSGQREGAQRKLRASFR